MSKNIIFNKINRNHKKHKNVKQDCDIVGISFCKNRKRWVVQKKNIKTKRFKTLEEAKDYLYSFN